MHTKLHHRLMIQASICLLLWTPCAHAVGKEDKPAPADGNFAWNSIQINGKEYIPIHQVKTFYQFDHLETDNHVTTLKNTHFTLSFSSRSQQMTLNTYKYFLSEPVRVHANSPHISMLDLKTLIDPLLRPDQYQLPPLKTIILDPGHGGIDKGAAKTESRHTLLLAQLIQKDLTRRGYKVTLTRELDVFAPLKNRVKMANAIPNAIFVSLHFNSSTNKNARGFETYIMSARQPNAANAASVTLATITHSQSLRELNRKGPGNAFNMVDRGVRRARFSILSECNHPAVIIEGGFLTNEVEAKNIHNPFFRQRLARGIANGIHLYGKILENRQP